MSHAINILCVNKSPLFVSFVHSLLKIAFLLDEGTQFLTFCFSCVICNMNAMKLNN